MQLHFILVTVAKELQDALSYLTDVSLKDNEGSGSNSNTFSVTLTLTCAPGDSLCDCI